MELNEFHAAIFAWHMCSFGPPSRAHHMKRGGMQLHEAAGINCKKGATTENQGSGVRDMGKGVYLDDCLCVLSDKT